MNDVIHIDNMWPELVDPTQYLSNEPIPVGCGNERLKRCRKYKNVFEKMNRETRDLYNLIDWIDCAELLLLKIQDRENICPDCLMIFVEDFEQTVKYVEKRK